MAATVIVNRWTGTTGSPTKSNVTGINSRLVTADLQSTNDTTNSILIPTSGTNYSYWAVFRLAVSAITAGTVNNIKWFTDGTNSMGTGTTLNVQTATTYVQATGTVGTTGTALNTTNYSTLAGAPVSAFTYTSGSPLSVAGSTTTTGDVGDFVVMQLAVGTTAAQGTTTTETITWRYDDTSS